MSNRSAILRAIKAAAGTRKTSRSDIAREASALVADPALVRPDLGENTLVERFIAKATSERVTATVTRVESMVEVPAAAALYLKENGQKRSVAVQPTTQLEMLDWDGFGRTGDLIEDGGVAVTLAEFGIAETGSVVFRSGSDAPILLNFLPSYHIVVLETAKILPYLEDLWSHLGRANITQSRLLTLVTGTSGTADIEAKNVRGAHGPRNMHIVLCLE